MTCVEYSNRDGHKYYKVFATPAALNIFLRRPHVRNPVLYALVPLKATDHSPNPHNNGNQEKSQPTQPHGAAKAFHEI